MNEIAATAERTTDAAFIGTAAARLSEADADLIARYDRRIPRYTSYPTAPHFTPEVGPEIYDTWLRTLPGETALSLYIHIPFCAELCLYCGCHTTVVRRYEPVASYVKLLEAEIDLVAERLGRRPVTHIHWGGGTPTMLSAADLLGLSCALRLRFEILPNAEIAVEIDPRVLTRERVEALAATGVTRASLGVQDFDPLVQQTINRVQSYARTAQAAEWLRRAGIRNLNFDLMYGLPHQTVDKVVNSVRLALSLQPDRIALFAYAHVPWMKRHQALLPEDAMPDAAGRLAQMRAAADTVMAAGYVQIGLDHFAKPDDELARSQKERRLHRNFQGYTADAASALIGFGTSSIGALPQGYVQNAPTTVAYREAIRAGRLAAVRGIALTAEDRLRRAVIERLMCDLAVDLDDIAAKHGVAPGAFAPELAKVDELAACGIVEREQSRIRVPDAARPFVRTACAVFDTYLSEGEGRYSRAL